MLKGFIEATKAFTKSMEIANCAALFLFQIMRNTIHVFQKAVDALLSVYESYEVQMLSGVTTQVEYIHSLCSTPHARRKPK